MVRECEKCGAVYDDETRWTICPHGPLGGANAYCRIHDLDPCPFCDPTAENPAVYRHESGVTLFTTERDAQLLEDDQFLTGNAFVVVEDGVTRRIQPADVRAPYGPLADLGRRWRKLRGGHWERWWVDEPVSALSWHRVDACSRVSGLRPTGLCRGTPVCEQHGQVRF